MNRSIGIYMRLSKAERRGKVSGSIERQRLLLWEWINRQRSLGVPDVIQERCPHSPDAGVAWQYEDCVKEYIDDGYSGMTENRPGYEGLLGAVLTGKIGLVLVKDFSRLSRNHLVLAELKEHMFPLHDVRLVALGDGYDSLYASGEELGYDFRSLFYEYYCHDISRKVKGALRAKKENGEYATGAVPFGYKNINGTWYIQPEEADILRFLFDEIAAGRSYQKAGEAVGMDAARVWYLVHNPVYLGQQVWHRYENHIGRQKKTSVVQKKDWNIRKKAHEAIVSEEIFNRIQNKRRFAGEESAGTCGRSDGRIHGGRHIFSGITKCRDCGRALVRGRRKQDTLCCRHCTGREGMRIAVWELMEICRRKIIEQYGEETSGSYMSEQLASCTDTETVRVILQEFFKRIEVDCQGDVWILWNFMGD